MVRSTYSTVAVRNAAVIPAQRTATIVTPAHYQWRKKIEPPLLCTLDEWMVKAPAIVPIQSRFCGMEVYMVVVGFGKL